MPDKLQIVCPHCDAVNRVSAGRDARGGKCGRCQKMLFEGKATPLTGARFDKHIGASSIPVIVDFWASWCGPCRMMGPIFEKAAGELEPHARFVKIDVDAEQAIAGRYAISSIPVLFLFKDGKPVARHAGVAEASLLRKWAAS